MTSPKHAQDTNRGRYYHHPVTGEALVSVTNVLGTCVAKQALVPWAAKIAGEYAIEHLPELVVRSRTEDREALRKEISGQVKVTTDKASDLGTRVHAGAEARVLGTGGKLEPDVAPFVDQYVRWLEDWKVDIERDVYATEMTVADPAKGYAGTLDLGVYLRGIDGFMDGKVIWSEDPDQRRLVWVDFKSSATRARTSGYPEYVLQLAALRYAKEMWLPDDTVAKLPPAACAAVLNLRPRSYAFIPVDASPAAHRAFCALLEGTKWLHARDGFEAPVDPPGTPPARKTTARKRTTRKAA